MRHQWLVWLICVLMMIAVPVLAQEDEGEEPLPPPHHSQAKIGGAAGFTQSLLFLNLDPINSVLTKYNAAPFNNNPLFMLGGQGYGYIMLIKNLRVGGMGMSGSMTSKSIDTSTNVQRDVSLSVGYGGVTIDYVVPVFPRLDVTFGALLGGGNLTLRLTHNDGTAKAWSNLWNDLGQTGNSNGQVPVSEFTHTISGSFFIYQPSINVEYAVLQYLGIRLGVSYNGMAGNSWTLDGNDAFSVVGVPSDISGKGIMINGGIFIGTFLF